METIILASESPRRREYFKLLGLPFKCISPKIDESFPPGSDPVSVVKDLAVKKVKAILEMRHDELRDEPRDKPHDEPPGEPPLWVCGADTLVSCGKSIFGKPRNRIDAKNILKALQGKTHHVTTAIALFGSRTGKIDVCVSTSSVALAELAEREIEWYLDTNEWKGAAGAYRIQGLASCFIEKINGSYSSIVGLPLRELYAMLRQNNYPYGG